MKKPGVDYIPYQHKSSEIKTFEEFFNSPQSPVKGYSRENLEGSILEFLNFDVDGYSNYDRLKDFVADQGPEAKDKLSLAKEVGVPFDIVFLIPIDRASLSLSSITGFDIQTSFQKYVTFFTDFQKRLQADPDYYPRYKFSKDGGKYGTLDTKLSVFLVTKVSTKTEFPEPQILDITKSINTITTNVGKSGGNFSISLSPQVVEGDYQGVSVNSVPFSKNISRLVSENDVIFIRFETLESEEVRKVSSYSDIPGKIYDMIGLVDKVNEVRTPTDYTLEMTGRDLVKVLIDDQSYFYPLLFTDSVTGSFSNETRNELMRKRLFSTGKIENTFVFSWRSIELSLKFIYTQLASMGVLPENFDIFSGYGDRRAKYYEVTEQGGQETGSFVNGIWQIMKLQIDESVSGRYIADPSISNPDGSILNQFNKICQEPFVEFTCDTYGDEYYLMARKPPFDRQSVVDLLNQPGAIIDIEPGDVLQVNLSFDTEVYTWYEIDPQGAFIGSRENHALAYIPILYLPEYAQIWGARRMKVVSNYVSYRSFFGQRGVENYGEVKAYVIQDLLYLVEINAYKPFTRRGSIILQNGDRRIKRGNWVRLKQTRELFYVDSVTQNATVSKDKVDRTCTLQVERGMVEKFIVGSESLSYLDSFYTERARPIKDSDEIGWNFQKIQSNRINYSYFNLVNLSYIQKVLESTLIRTEGSATRYKRLSDKSEAGVNTDIFNFFLNRRQFAM